MAKSPKNQDYKFEISLSVLNHLGRNLYRNFITVLGEAISNSWDADAANVWIDIDKESLTFSIKDDGTGMSANDFQGKFLKIGYSKRGDGQIKSKKKRPYIGAKGIGKLALLSCADRVSVFSKVSRGDYVGGTIDNRDLDRAITSDLVPSDYPLEPLNYSLIEDLTKRHKKGTIIIFEDTKEHIRNSISHIRKLLAMSFHFSVLGDDFNIFVNDEIIGLNDLKDLTSATQFVWLINGYEDDYVKEFSALSSRPKPVTTKLDISGFIATVNKPRDLKISGTDERATLDLFVNGRLREKNIIRHIPTQRIVESYLYGQIHFDAMDDGSSDPFTSSREGVVEGDPYFNAMLDYLKRDLIPKVIDDWDKLRLRKGEEGDDENPRKTKKARKARALYSSVAEEYDSNTKGRKNLVDRWIKDLLPDAEFNISSYVECFLSENLVRNLILHKKIKLSSRDKNEIKKWKGQEKTGLEKANISFEVRKKDADLSYLSMDTLAIIAEGSKASSQSHSLHLDAIDYKPVRNVVGHTGLLTDLGKSHLRLKYENIKGRVKALLKDVK